MRYFKLVNEGYILFIGKGSYGEEITESEYNEILSVIQNHPQETETTAYRLKDDLTWEPYEIEPIPESDEVDDSEALEILLGGAL